MELVLLSVCAVVVGYVIIKLSELLATVVEKYEHKCIEKNNKTTEMD